jgi:UDP-glucose 4-epimerase
MNKSALVTGGAGFIGSHLVDALLAKGWDVSVIDNLSTGFRKNLDRRVRFKNIDVRSPHAARFVERLKPDALFHLAAQASVPESVKDPVRDAEINLHATLRLLEAASRARVKRFIFAGTGGALSSESTRLPTDEIHAAPPSSPYAIAKVGSEYYGAFYRNWRKLNFTSFRFANVYGPRQNPHGEAGVIAIFCKRMLANQPLKINGSGLQTRDYVFVSDVVDAMLRGLRNPKAAGPYHVGTGIETNVQTLFKKLAKLTGYRLKPGKGPADIGAPMRSALDSSKLTHDLGWQPEVALEEGLRRTVEWFQARA